MSSSTLAAPHDEPRSAPSGQPYDCVVVGAGPAGSLAALVLAREGYHVALLDRSRFPRPKVCGDCVNPNSWALWERHGLLEGFRSLPHHVPRGLVLELGERAVHRQTFGLQGNGAAPAERAVKRALLDDWLRQEAIKSGVEFFPERTVCAATLDGTVRTTTGEEFRGRYVLGADGRNSLVAKTSGLASPARRCQRVAWQATVPAQFVPDDHVHMRVFPEGYYGLTRTDADHANLCLVLGARCGVAPQAIALRYLPGVPALAWKSIHPIARPAATSLGQHRLWLAGDAADVVEPFTGQGIYLALTTGELAGQALAQALRQEGSGSATALEQYRRAHGALYRREAWLNRWIGWAAQNPGRGEWALRWLARVPWALRVLVRQVHPAHAASNGSS